MYYILKFHETINLNQGIWIIQRAINQGNTFQCNVSDSHNGNIKLLNNTLLLYLFISSLDSDNKNVNVVGVY